MEKQKILLVGAVIVVVAIASWLIFRKPDVQILDTDASRDSGDVITDSVTEGVVDVNTNPLKNAPDINPVEKSNPYANVKTNPFE